MYTIIYQFKIKPGQTKQFELAWSEFTEAIFRVRGSLGSRLHKTDDEHLYIAYAQWPSKELFDEVVPLERYTQVELAARKSMVDSVVETVTLHKMTMLDDHLRSPS